MVSARQDSVTNIHKRWSITRLNPSSYKISISISLAAAALIITLSYLYGSNGKADSLAISLFYGISAIIAFIFLDYLALYGTANNKLSKIFHVSAFGNLLWTAVLSAGIAIDSLLGNNNNNSNIYLLEGMLVVTGFRIAIFTSVFGSGIFRAVIVSFIAPVLFIIVFLTPGEFYKGIPQHLSSLLFGSFFVIWAIVWSLIADKAGRPHVSSTFNLLQAFLSAWTEQKAEKIEEIVDSRAKNNRVTSNILKFVSNEPSQKATSIVIPGVHPGPFGPIGGSNLPYELYKFFSMRAIVVHSPSDHSYNIPSKTELEKYLLSLATSTVSTIGCTCTEPVQIKKGQFAVTSIAFGNVSLVILSMPSRGMEDVPVEVSSNLQEYALNLGFSNTLVVDSHNAMGSALSNDEQQNLILCARETLDQIKVSERYQFSVGFASSAPKVENRNDNVHIKNREDMGQGGLAVIAIEVNKKRYAIGWADSNNMDRQVRNGVLSDLNSQGFNMIEVCTSDTHSTSGKRTRLGYYPLGSISDVLEIGKVFRKLAQKSFADIEECCFELLSVESNIKVMGKGQFDDYSKALDRSMKITKIFLAISTGMALSMLLVT
jgi:putative membrane protein